jgi:PIN domain nuclease of toxin-antitoxin system
LAPSNSALPYFGMRLLLDTQIYLWWLADSRRLPKSAREQVTAADEVYVSAASIWECERRIAQGSLDADPRELVRGIADSGFSELPVRAQHAATLAALPDGQGDAFDRVLVAQAIFEPLRLLTTNAAIAGYSDLVEVIAPKSAND